MPTTLRTFSVLAALGTVVLGCSSSTEMPRELQASIAVVHGRVVRAEGVGVPGTFVRVLARPIASGGCVDGPGWLSGTGLSDGAGNFSIRGSYLGAQRVRMCVDVEARPPEESGLRTVMVAGGTVDFVHPSLTPPLDSVRVDVTLPPGE